jgi:AraC-like DNA-binding protein
MTLSHLWYLPVAFHTSSVEILQSYLVGAMLDFMTLIPCAIVLLLVLLQDRRRPLWPVGVMVAPVIIGLAVSLVYNYFDIMPQFYGYHLLLAIGLIIYMVRATRQYGHWLRDNYADLENKEVWQSFVVLAVVVLVFGIYASGVGGPAYEYIIQVCGILLICYLLWRVETLSDLSISQPLAVAVGEKATSEKSTTATDDIGALLQLYCVDTKLYLQHDLTVTQLAQAIGTNRFYLGQYFSRQDATYNAYINTLRINHFLRLYREAVDAQRTFTAQQLANDSGYRSYSTFSLAFKQRMGQSVTAWMREQEA